MTKILIIIVVAAVVVALLKIFKTNSTEERHNNTRPNTSLKSTEFVENDKIVVIKNVDFKVYQKVIAEFCNIYNQESYRARVRFYAFENECVVMFPYDIDFVCFCFFINYVKYGFEIPQNPKPDVKAWCSTKSGEEWIKNDIANRKVMLSIPDWDEEYDNVYLTSEDNIGYMMGFAVGEESKKLNRPAFEYQKNNFDISKLQNAQFVDFE